MSNPFQVVAIVAPGSTNNGRYHFTLGGWTFSDSSSIAYCSSNFPETFDPVRATAQLRNLERILLAMFVLDHIPRNIVAFDYSLGNGLTNDEMFYVRLLGQQRMPFDESDEQIAFKSYRQSGWIFNHKPRESADGLPSFDSIQDWYDLILRHPDMFSSLTLLQESFRRINLLFGTYHYGDHLNFLTAVLMLISGLESIFFHGFDDHADISFKFQVVGAAMYSKFAEQSFLNRFGSESPGQSIKKISFVDFRQILKNLYSFRSKIAHGSIANILEDKDSIKKWNRIISVLHVATVDSGSSDHLRSHISIALGMLQRHILAMVVGAREKILNASAVFDEVMTKGSN